MIYAAGMYIKAQAYGDRFDLKRIGTYARGMPQVTPQRTHGILQKRQATLRNPGFCLRDLVDDSS